MSSSNKEKIEKSSLEKKTVGGIFWTILEMVGRQGITFIIQILLARLLAPEDFGLIGMLAIFIALSNLLIDCGFQTWLIHKKDASESEFSTVFFFNIIAAAVIYCMLFITAPYIGEFYNRPILTNMLRVLSLAIIFNSFALIHRTKLTIALNFKVQTYITTIGITCSGIIAVILAYLGFGVWSLVIQQVTASVIQSILLILANRWMPKLAWNSTSFVEMFQYSWKLLASYLLDIVFNNTNSILIGKFFSAGTLGYFTNAQKMNDVAAASIAQAVQKVSFPILSGMKSDKKQLRSGYQRILTLTSFATVPIMLGLSACGLEIFSILFGEKWLRAVPYFRVMCFGGMLYPFHFLNLNILQVTGRTDRFLVLEVIKKIIGVIGVIVTLVIFRNVMALVWAAVVMGVISLYINSYFSKELIDYSLKEQLKDIDKVIFAGVAMYLILWGVDYFTAFSAFPLLILKIIIGIFVYGGICLLLRVREIKLIKQISYQILNKLKKKTK